jgi:hypothetical protein
MTLYRDRGSALVVTLILITILSIVALALVKRSTNEIESVSAKRHYDATAFTGHYSTTLPDGGLSGYVADGGVVPLQSSGGGGSSGGASDTANKINKLAFGTTPYRITVVCQDVNNVSRQTEVEFTVNYGL